MEPTIDLEVAVMKGLCAIKPLNSLKREFDDWDVRISRASNEELVAMISEAAEWSHMEESLAREFVRRKLDSHPLMEAARFRTTKAILQGRL
jgi:hypothetical protein